MPKYPFGKTRIIDDLQRSLDEIEKTWPMTGSYQRIEPYISPLFRANEWFEIIIYHVESKAWFDNYQNDFIMNSLADKELVVPGDVAFDLGSNAGAITLLLAKLCGPTGHVYAFDPYPWNTVATKSNALINHFDNVTAYPVGVSNRNHQISVSPNDSRSYESSDANGCQVLNIRAINDFMPLKPTFLKIDIEGAEYDIFNEQHADVFESVRGFVLEFHPMWIRPRNLDPKDVLRNIEGLGFTLHGPHADDPIYAVEQYDERHLFWGKRRATLGTTEIRSSADEGAADESVAICALAD